MRQLNPNHFRDVPDRNARRIASRQNALNALWCDGVQVGGLTAPRNKSTKEKANMIAHFVHDRKKARDTIYLPDRGCFIPVDKTAMERFISVKPDFANWTGQACALVNPEEFGTVVATRDDQGDVCILRQDLWRERMFANLGNPMDQRH
jgi:hypothetical protein